MTMTIQETVAALCKTIIELEAETETLCAQRATLERQVKEAHHAILKVLKWVPEDLRQGWIPEVADVIAAAKDSEVE